MLVRRRANRKRRFSKQVITISRQTSTMHSLRLLIPSLIEELERVIGVEVADWRIKRTKTNGARVPSSLGASGSIWSRPRSQLNASRTLWFMKFSSAGAVPHRAMATPPRRAGCGPARSGGLELLNRTSFVYAFVTVCGMPRRLSTLHTATAPLE